MKSGKNSRIEQQPVLVACALHSALGDIDATWNGLMAGQSALQPVSFSDIPNVYPVGRVADLDGSFGTQERLRSLIRKGLGGIHCLSEIAGRSDIIVATTKGAADELLNTPDKLNGQPWQLGEMIADITGCPNTPQTVSAACASGTVALIQAGKRIISGASEVVIVVGIDLLSKFVIAGFDALKGLSSTPCRPFDRDRDGLSLGEGIGVIVVASQQFAGENELKTLARVSGWGVSCDATHITAPCRHGSGLQRVLTLATENGTIRVGAVNAHGTGTRYNDAMEMTAFRNFWPQTPPIHSIKGAVGHCLGAAGVIEAALSIHSLRHGCIPPTVGLEQEESLTGKLSGRVPFPLERPSILSCNSGFGGINAGILFSAPG